MSRLHPTAIVEDGVTLGQDCTILAGAVLRRGTILGDRVTVHPYAVIGGEPQFLNFDPATESGVAIGPDTVVREHVTINRSIHAGGRTTIGARGFLMAACHVGHDCALGDHVVVANAALLAGHVTIGDHCFLGGAALFHQFVRIGEGAIVSGGARAGQDVPPFTMVAERNELIGLNLVGLRRREIPRETIRELKAAFRAVCLAPGSPCEHAARAAAAGAFQTAEARRFLAFFAGSRRGFARARRGGRQPPADDAG